MNFNAIVLALVLSSSLVAMDKGNDNSSWTDINDSVSTQTDWTTTTPSGNN